MDISISAVKLNLLAPIGSMSEKRLNLLDERLLVDYPMKQIPDGKTVIYVNPQKGTSVIVGPNQISFGVESIEKLVPQMDTQKHLNDAIASWVIMSNAIVDDLTLDQVCDMAEIELIAFISTHKSNGKAAAENLIQKFSPIHRPALKEICDPIAVGLRYIFERERLIYDSRIEPFLANLSQYLYSMNIKTKDNKQTFEEIFKVLNDNLEFFSGQWFTFIKDSILI